MSQTSKIVLGIIVLVALVALGYWYWNSHQTGTQPSTATSASSADVKTLPSGQNTSDAAIGQDLNAIDAQLSAVHSDNTQAKQSVNAAVQ